jgi:hypothetical protein
MKKTYLIILMILLTLFICPTHTVVDASAEKEIDIYLIAGQSNAVGYTIVDENGKADLNQMDPRFTSGFDKVLYYGCSNVNVGAKLPTMTVQTTKIGLGKDNNCIGPELGMAQYFSNLSTNQVGIIKYASGASSIYDDYKSTQNSQRGNWYSPSVEKAIGIPAGNTSISGNCYRVFLEVVKEGLKAYKELGYKPVIKGLAWMQGEAECQSKEYSAKYATLLKALISDIRTELSKETGQDLSTMHVVVAKIPSHYKPTNPSYTDVVREQQQFVADNDAFITTIDNAIRDVVGENVGNYITEEEAREIIVEEVEQGLLDKDVSTFFDSNNLGVGNNDYSHNDGAGIKCARISKKHFINPGSMITSIVLPYKNNGDAWQNQWLHIQYYDASGTLIKQDTSNNTQGRTTSSDNVYYKSMWTFDEGTYVPAGYSYIHINVSGSKTDVPTTTSNCTNFRASIVRDASDVHFDDDECHIWLSNGNSGNYLLHYEVNYVERVGEVVKRVTSLEENITNLLSYIERLEQRITELEERGTYRLRKS